MGYKKQEFINKSETEQGTKIRAEHLQHIENGLVETEALANKAIKIAETGGNGIGQEEINAAVNTALQEAKESGAFDGPAGNNGKDGTSITITNITESSENGGENEVTFSDGNSLKVKNGQRGEDGKTPEKGTDYYTEADKDEMVDRVIAALPTWGGGNY